MADVRARVFLVAAAGVALGATENAFLAWPWDAITWYVWLPAEAAFATAPAYQLLAIRNASLGA